MTIGLSKMTEDAEKLLDQGRILPGLELLKQARSMTKIPFRRLFLTFNIGVVYWDKLGDGISARSEFLAAANSQGSDRDEETARVLRANALENLMLLASSYDEFDEFTAMLRILAPQMPIVSGLPPHIHDMRDHGSPWSSELFNLAMMNYDRNDPSRDRGRYGVAKSTYHILLAARKQQRLSREDWRMAVFEYCALAMRMANDCQNLRGGDADANSPEEFLPMLTDSIPYMDEYLAVFAGDDAMQQVRDNMQSILENTRARWAAISPDRPEEEFVAGIGHAGHLPAFQIPQTNSRRDTGLPSARESKSAGRVLSAIWVAAIVAGLITWHFAAAQPLWARGLWTLGVVTFVFALVSPIVFQLWLARFKNKSD
jgi:hypothetical protein